MGEVYRARDTKLRRDVALKVHPDRLARLEREAQILASLNHPNIATIYGIEGASSETGHVLALVLELVEGPTLADRIVTGPVPIEEALSIARQVAEALGAAHEHGIVHRDLKPANIKVRADGAVKVLDFGLARSLDPEANPSELSHSPTVTSPALTRAGVILGTARYMAPEQATGKGADARSDIWAFGLVLYEMLTGQPGFAGETTVEVLSNVLKMDPDWAALPATTPVIVRSLLRRSLQKDPARRLRDIVDARFQIEEVLTAPVDPVVATPTRGPRTTWAWLGALLVVASTVGATGWFIGRSMRTVSELRLDITTPPTTDPTSMAISPDGRQVVLVATSGSQSRLWLRALDAASAHPLPGTENAMLPFWSPDSRSVGFFANGLKRIDVGDGTVRTLARAGGRGGAWGKGGKILVAGNDVALYEISADGGELTQVTQTNAQMPTNWFPQFLHDDRHFLFYATGAASGIYVAQLGSSDAPRRILGDVQAATFAATSGHLLFVRQGTLFAQPFDVARLELTGSRITVADRILVGSVGSAALSVSAAGPILYRTGGLGPSRELVWFDRSGKELGRVTGSAAASRSSVSLSPDGRRVAYEQILSGETTTDVWLLDLNRGIPSRFTIDSDFDLYPIWSPDGRRVVFSRRKGSRDWDLYVKQADGVGGDEPLLATDQYETSQGDWSHNGFFLYRGGGRMSALPVDGQRKPFAVSRTAGDQPGKFSPDGRWIAYPSNESGRNEVYIQRFPGPGPKAQVSRDGGRQVLWRHDGKELFYLELDNQMTAVSIVLDATTNSAEIGTPVPLFTANLPVWSGGWQYAVSADGQRFLVDALEDVTLPITVVLNWTPKP
jgi:serine/threonine protein kinase